MKSFKISTTTVKVTAVAVFMALNIVMCTFSIPVPGGHLYLCDAIICCAALMLDPVSAFIVGGVGSFLGDMMFYPVAMFVSLFAHGLQALFISMISHYTFKNHKLVSTVLGLAVGSVFMVGGYFLGKTFVYANFQTAVIKLPYEILQAVVGAVLAFLLCRNAGLYKLADKFGILYSGRGKM
ncbi:MAG: ECF transporter S component [Clostridia bacterium]|nr:ECF transporter S component [Clostridia bacterium]